MGFNVVVVDPRPEVRDRLSAILGTSVSDSVSDAKVTTYNALGEVPADSARDAGLFIISDRAADRTLRLDFLTGVRNSRMATGQPMADTILLNGGKPLTQDEDILLGVIANISAESDDATIKTAVTTALNPPSLEDITKLMGKGYSGFVVDWLYPNVRYYLDPHQANVKSSMVIKRREDTATARYEAEALVSFGLRAHPRGDTVLVEHIMGIETHDLYRQIRGKTERLDRRLEDGKIKVQTARENREILRILKATLLEKQVDMLAKYQVTPYTPRNDDGSEYVENPDTVAYYKANVMRGSQETNPVLEEALSFMDDFLGPYASSRVVRYVDMYSRNHGLQIGKINAIIEDYIKAIRRELPATRKQREHGRVTISAWRIRDFVARNFRQFDAHRVTKKMFDLEDLFHIIYDPRARLSEVEQEHYYALFLLKREYEQGEHSTWRDGIAQRKRNEKMRDVERRISEPGKDPILLTLNELNGLVPEEHLTRDAYYYALLFHRMQRWHSLVEREYLPRYEANMADAQRAMEAIFTNAAKSSGTTIEDLMRYLAQNDDKLFLKTREYYRGVIADFKNTLDQKVGNRQVTAFIREANRYKHNQIMHHRYTRDLQYYDEMRQLALTKLMEVTAETIPSEEFDIRGYRLDHNSHGVRLVHKTPDNGSYKPIPREEYKQNFDATQSTSDIQRLIKIDYVRACLIERRV